VGVAGEVRVLEGEGMKVGGSGWPRSVQRGSGIGTGAQTTQHSNTAAASRQTGAHPLPQLVHRRLVLVGRVEGYELVRHQQGLGDAHQGLGEGVWIGLVWERNRTSNLHGHPRTHPPTRHRRTSPHKQISPQTDLHLARTHYCISPHLRLLDAVLGGGVGVHRRVVDAVGAAVLVAL
jgi:hypothetical protein